MKKVFYLFLLIFGYVNAQDLKTYQFYNQKGKEISFAKTVDILKDYDVVLFGEYHNNSTIHWLQLKLTEHLYKAKKGNIILGAEMFERDNQSGLNKYLKGELNDKNLSTEVRLWSNFTTDYKPLLDFAKNNSLPFIATNIPRKYASSVAKNGLNSLDDLSDSDKLNMVKLPFPLDFNAPGYPEMIEMMGDHAGDKAQQFVAAQAIKDATMAESIINNYTKDILFLHFNGDYHSKQYGGIYWYLKQYNPALKVAVIQVTETNDPSLKMNLNKKQDFIFTEILLVLPEDTIKTY